MKPGIGFRGQDEPEALIPGLQRNVFQTVEAIFNKGLRALSCPPLPKIEVGQNG